MRKRENPGENQKVDGNLGTLNRSSYPTSVHLSIHLCAETNASVQNTLRFPRLLPRVGRNARAKGKNRVKTERRRSRLRETDRRHAWPIIFKASASRGQRGAPQSKSAAFSPVLLLVDSVDFSRPQCLRRRSPLDPEASRTRPLHGGIFLSLQSHPP